MGFSSPPRKVGQPMSSRASVRVVPARPFADNFFSMNPVPRRRLVVPLLILMNVIVFFFWSVPDNEEFMVLNFSVSWSGLIEGRYWTLLTSVFSHEMLLHIFINMFVLQSFGSVLEEVLGPKRFLSFYLIAGVMGSFTHAWVSAFIVGDPNIPAVGASGAIAGLVLVFSLVFPRERILIFGLIPVPAIFGAFAFIGLDLWGLTAQAGGGGLPIGHGAHLGGAFTGMIYYFLVLRRRLKR